MIQSWVFESDFREFVEILAILVQYDLGEVEKEILEENVGATNAEEERWYSNDFKGKRRIKFSFAKDPGTQVVHFRIENAQEIDKELGTLFLIAHHYHLENRNETR